MKTVSVGSVVIALLSFTSCASDSRRELWIIPEGYVGWLKLEYSIPGAPPLPFQDGKLVVRFPRTGQLQTSSVNRPRRDRIEYVTKGPEGLRNLKHPPSEDIDDIASEYAIQNAFSYGKGVLGSPPPPPEVECAFVGIRWNSARQPQSCLSWKFGTPVPPNQ